MGNTIPCLHHTRRNTKRLHQIIDIISCMSTREERIQYLQEQYYCCPFVCYCCKMTDSSVQNLILEELEILSQYTAARKLSDSEYGHFELTQYILTKYKPYMINQYCIWYMDLKIMYEQWITNKSGPCRELLNNLIVRLYKCTS